MATEENPYAPPKQLDRAVGVNSGKREDLRTIAVAQKSIIVCILLNFAALAARFVIPPNLIMIVVAVLLVVFVVQLVSVVILASKVSSTFTAIIYGVGSVVPCLSLIILLVVNNKANKILTQNGHRVGLFGANLAEF